MKKILFFFFIISSFALAEEFNPDYSALLPNDCRWRWVNPLPQGNNLNFVTFINNDVVFITGENGTLLKSTDAGLTWNIIKLMNYRNNFEYFFDENNILLVDDRYLATKNPDSNWADKNIYKTTDGGKNWTKSTTKVMQIEFNYIFHFLDMNTGYYVPENKDSVILKTTNCGSSWDTIKMPLLIDYSSRLIIRNTDLFYIFNKNFIMKTTDGAATWKKIENINEADYYSYCFLNDSIGWINSSIGLLKTTDCGDSWNLISNKIIDNYARYKFIDKNIGYVTTSSGLIQLFKTTDGGVNWKRISAGTGFDSQINSYAASEDGVFIGVGDNGIIKRTTDDGITWLNMDKGFKNNLSNIQFIDNENGWIVGNYGALFQTTDGGNSWEDKKNNILNDDLFYLKFFNNKIGIIAGFHSDYYNNNVTFYKTTDAGSEWTELGSITDIYSASAFFLNEQIGWTKILTEFNEYILYKTTDGGMYWTTQKSFKDTNVTCIKFFDEQNGYALSGNNKIIKTTDSGDNWTSYKQLDTNIYYYNLFFLNENIGWIIGKNLQNFCSAYKTTDAGNTWLHKLGSNNLVELLFIDENTGWVQGNNDSTFRTIDGGENWEFFSLSTDYSRVRSKCIINENTCWAVGEGGTILKYSCVETKVEENIPISNNEDFQIFPNPSSNEITLSFPENQNIYSISVFNSMGIEVKRIKQTKLIGNSKIILSISDLPNGLYHCSYANQTGKVTKSFVVLR